MDNVSGTAKAICDRNFRFECSKILEREGSKPSRYENLGFGCDFKEQAISYLKGFQGFFSQFRNNFATIHSDEGELVEVSSMKQTNALH